MAPVSVSFCWDDRDQDGIVDRGTCGCPNASDDGFPCDHNSDCSCSSCSPQSVVQEKNLVLKRNSQKFSYGGFGIQPFKCQDHHPGNSPCATVTAGCADPPGTGMATVANCCDDASGPTGSWGFQTCTFSELYLGDPVGDLAAGRGRRQTDCYVEWAVHNPTNTPFFDKRGIVRVKQECTDGDPACDADGMADGACTFEVGVCVKNEDPRLVKKGVSVCVPQDIASWRIRRPTPDSDSSVDAVNAVALRGAVEALDPSGSPTIGGEHQEVVEFSSAITEVGACTSLVPIEVPLKAPGRKGKVRLRTSAVPAGGGKPDKDVLILKCLPALP